MTLILPPLAASSEIVAQNVRILGPIYVAYEFERLKAFTVTDCIVELWQQGTLPVSRTTASRALSRYWQNAPNRLTESERRGVYARALGKNGDQQRAHVNREFDDLWMRFVSAVSAYRRQSRVRDTGPRRVSQTEVARRARELAANLSQHGYGMGYFVAKELQEQITSAVSVLSLVEVRSAFGARDMWQVIDRVAANELGGAVNVTRYPTMATSGLEIIRWLAARSQSKARARVPDRALVMACEKWLAASEDTEKTEATDKHGGTEKRREIESGGHRGALRRRVISPLKLSTGD